MQQTFDFLQLLAGDGQPDGDDGPAAVGVADVEHAAVALDDLVAHRQADAAAPGLGGALVKLLLYIGQLRLRNAGAVVSDTDDLLRPLRCQRGVNAPPGAACLAALSSTLQNTCFSRWGSPEMGSVYSS